MMKFSEKHIPVNNKGHILPISAFLAILGTYFAISSILYVVTNSYCNKNDDNVTLFIVEGAILFVAMMFTFFLIGIKNSKIASEIEAYNDSKICLDCIEAKMEDGFHNHGLLHLDELIAFEGELAQCKEPSKCKVLVYTSDLATEKNAECEVKRNIESGVQYIVLYFANNCKEEEYNRIRDLYGEENIVDLSKREEYKTSFDGQLALTLGFDIMIYKSSDSQIKGYFAVDFVPEDKPYRQCHDPNCSDKCNYGKESPIPFYKAVSFEIAKQLYNEGLILQKELYGKKE